MRQAEGIKTTAFCARMFATIDEVFSPSFSCFFFFFLLILHVSSTSSLSSSCSFPCLLFLFLFLLVLLLLLLLLPPLLPLLLPLLLFDSRALHRVIQWAMYGMPKPSFHPIVLWDVPRKEKICFERSGPELYVNNEEPNQSRIPPTREPTQGRISATREPTQRRISPTICTSQNYMGPDGSGASDAELHTH